MYTVRNLQFTRLYKVDGYLKEFNFRKSNPAPDGKCSVDTVDARGNRIMFRMQKETNQWKIVQQTLPSWILSSEAQFHELIEESLA